MWLQRLKDGALAVNAATCDAYYRPLQHPIVIDVPR